MAAPVTADALAARLREALSAEHVDVVDVSGGCGGKFEAVVVSSVFEGKPLLQRHRLVNAAISEELKSIHAFSQKTLTPEQWRAAGGAK